MRSFGAARVAGRLRIRITWVGRSSLRGVCYIRVPETDDSDGVQKKRAEEPAFLNVGGAAENPRLTAGRELLEFHTKLEMAW